MSRRLSLAVHVAATFLALTLLIGNPLAAADRSPDYQPNVFALTNVTAVVAPGETIEMATIVVRNGAIEAIGKSNTTVVPFDAVEIDATGLYAYPGLIDAYSTAGLDDKVTRSRTGEGQRVDYGSFALGATPPDNRNGLTPEFQVSDALALTDDQASPRREAGFTAALVAPGGGVATGQSSLVSLNGRPRREIIVASPIALHVALRSTGSRGYPSTTMGYVAHLRQAMIDARHYETLWDHYREHGGQRPPVDPTLSTLRAAQKGTLRVFWNADSRDEIHRALDLADEFGLTPVIVGGREAWKVADRLAAAKVPVVLRIDFPEEPKTTAGGGGRRGRRPTMTPERIKELLANPDLPAQVRSRMQDRLKELEGQSTAEKPEEKKEEKKLPESPRLLAEAKRKWRERIAGASILAKQGVLFCFSADGHRKPADFHKHVRQCIEEGLAADDALAAMTTRAAEILGVDNRMGRLAEGNLAHIAVFTGAVEDEKSKLRYAFVDADKFEFNKPKEGEQASNSDEKDTSEKEDAGEQTEQSKAKTQVEQPPGPESEQPPVERSAARRRGGPRGTRGASRRESADQEPFPTEIEADRVPRIKTGGDVAIKNANILTVTNGTIESGTILVQGGKITALGKNVEIPAGVQAIDAAGLWVMPGMIDTHSHVAISGGVNESSLAVVPEVRVKDVVTGDSESIYRALAGGLTAARLLHGSANPIGGQDAVIKLKHTRPGRELIVREGPRGVKFALGENPKRSTSRYPDTRLGVEAVIRRSFEEGKMYRRVWELYAAARSRGENLPEPRRDLRLEALADIVTGDLPIHSHCYRADEILMLMRTAESYGIRIKSLQHVLEGYKVAAEIAAHGASNSTFSDWWAYKVEAYDAIPHNAALLVKAGASVTLKSDDSELMRHMNQEAGKIMRYGGLTEQQALETVTINAARQIGLEHRIGSIEVGKDADLAIFNGHPLNSYSRCELTLVEGEVYFQRKGRHKAAGYTLDVARDKPRTPIVEIPTSASNVYVLTGARIVPVVGEVIENGSIVVRGSKIETVGAGKAAVPEDAVEIDLAGLTIYPGMINASGQIGLTEVRSLRETQDYSERGQYNSDLRASIALHPDSEIIPVTRANGVLTTLTRPTGGVICGQSVVMNLHGWIPPEMAVIDPAALHINFPTGSIGTGSGASRAQQNIEKLKDRMKLAVRYDAMQQQLEKNPRNIPRVDPKLASLAPYAKGEGLVVIHASRHGDIIAAIDFAKEMKLKWVLSDASEAWKCVKQLKENDVAVILGPSMSLPRGTGAPYDVVYRTAAMLSQAGVRFAMTAESDASQARNLPFQAAMSIAYGLPQDEGLKSVTLYPAQLLGVDGQLGSIEEGKLANLVICDGDMLQASTQVKALFVAGKPVPPTSRHTRLFARYQQRLDEVQQGQSPLGVGQPQKPVLVRDADRSTTDPAAEPISGESTEESSEASEQR